MVGIRTSAAVALTAALALTASACSSSSGNGKNNGSSGSSTAAAGPAKLTWWHNGTTDPVKSLWQQAANAYHSAHPNVTFTVDPIQNEQFTTKVPAALAGGNPPDIFQQWGGGQL
ncbi:MAG: extracellular solute-binding protein, partial [Actinocrinis sp.]